MSGWQPKRRAQLVAGILLLTACQAGPYSAIYPSEVPIEGDVAAIAHLAGRWYELGHPAKLEIELREPASLRLNLRWEGRLTRAYVEEGELYFVTVSAKGERTGWVREDGEDRVVLVAPGSEPSWCWTCTPRLTRTVPPTAAEILAQEVRETPERLRDDLLDFLIDYL